MVLLHSNPPEIGVACPEFSLVSVDDKRYCLADFSDSQALLVAFICNHCPYVRAIEDRLIALRKAFTITDLAMVGICSNDVKAYPDDSKEMLRQRWEEKSYEFPYLIDESQMVARAFHAICTPDLFLYDRERSLFYHGQLDDNWRDAHQVQEQSLKLAVSTLLLGQEPPQMQKPSMGCSIKWRPESTSSSLQ
jgi:peroxiredoxin